MVTTCLTFPSQHLSALDFLRLAMVGEDSCGSRKPYPACQSRHDWLWRSGRGPDVLLLERMSLAGPKPGISWSQVRVLQVSLPRTTALSWPKTSSARQRTLLTPATDSIDWSCLSVEGLLCESPLGGRLFDSYAAHCSRWITVPSTSPGLPAVLSISALPSTSLAAKPNSSCPIRI